MSFPTREPRIIEPLHRLLEGGKFSSTFTKCYESTESTEMNYLTLKHSVLEPILRRFGLNLGTEGMDS